MDRADARLIVLAVATWLATVLWLWNSAGCSSVTPC